MAGVESPAVAARLADLARQDPDGCALESPVDEQVRLGWRELDRQTAALSVLLRQSAGPDGVLVLPVANTAAAVLAVLGCLRAGISVVPVNARMPGPEQQSVLHRCAERFGRPVHLVTPDGSRAASVLPTRSSAGVPPGYALLTGGSSGTPKLVPFPAPVPYQPHRYPDALLRRTGMRTGVRHLVVAPLHHAAAFSCFLEGLLAGVCTVLLPAFDAAGFWSTVRDVDAQWMLLTPTHMRAAAEHPVPPGALEAVEAVLHTAAPCDAHLKRRWIELLGPRRLFEMYGSTEGTGVTLIRGDEWLAHPGSVGRGVWTRIQVLDAAGHRVPIGEVGDVHMRTASASGAAATRTPDGYARTGDRGRLDAAGYLYLTGRADDLLIVGGENVYPTEVESVLREHPAVADAAVVAVPDALLGNRLRALVVATGTPDAPTPAQLRRHCAQRLTGFKVPARIELCDSLPRNAAGKLERWRITDQRAGTRRAETEPR